MEVGLFFGSFNPIHIGHLIIANIAYETTSIEELWFIVSPQNPFKKNKNLLHEFDRIDMVRAAVHDHYRFRVSDIEFDMPRPSYTIDTLARLSDKYPQHHFRLLIGEDNLDAFHKWKNHDRILEYYGLIVYPRPNAAGEGWREHPAVEWIEAPKIDISATFIRKLIKANKSVKYLVADEVLELIEAKKLFQ
ncbi:MAG: nicotinate (nicotinamide) nucleotide adenylyltransferase [Bacteroidota bacterium]